MTGTPVESADYGYGGAALAVAANGTTNQTDIYFGVISYYPNNQYHSGQSTDPSVDNMTGAVVALHWNGTAFSSSQLKILETGGEKAFGVCGIAVGDLIPTSPGDEIVVGTLDGKLLVYERLANGNFGALLYQTVLEGSVGAYNSMVIADLGPTPLAGNALYVAGSFGLRKFVYNPPPPLLNGQRR